MSTIVKLVFNPNLNSDNATPILYNQHNDLALGWVLLNPDLSVEWCYARDTFDTDYYDAFAEDFGEWLKERELATACWGGSTDTDQMLARMEHSHLTWYFDQNQNTPLIPYADFKAMVDNWLAVVPATFALPHAELELGDLINEVGLSSVGKHSIGNMLTHYHSESWSWKAERMTIIAYRYDLDIHPLAIAMTPFVAADLRCIQN